VKNVDHNNDGIEAREKSVERERGLVFEGATVSLWRVRFTGALTPASLDKWGRSWRLARAATKIVVLEC